MEEQLQIIRQNTSVETHRMSAVNMFQARFDPRFAGIRAHGFNPIRYPIVQGKWGIAGCTFSHLTLLMEMRKIARNLQAQHEVWLILEDDAIVTPDIITNWKKLWPYVPNRWDILRLGWFGGDNCSGRVNGLIDLALWNDPPPHGPCRYCGSHAYIVNPASLDKVIQRLQNSHIMHVDCLLGAQTPPNENPTLVPPLLSFAARPRLSIPNE